MVPRPQIKGWLVWLYYLNPLTFTGMDALSAEPLGLTIIAADWRLSMLHASQCILTAQLFFPSQTAHSLLSHAWRVALAVWGLVGSQLSDVNDQQLMESSGQMVSVRQYMESYYNLYHGFLGYAVLVLAGFIILFHFVTAFALMKLNYLKR